jgi:hypothetical protein
MRDLLIILGVLLVLVLVVSALGGSVTVKRPEAFISPLDTITPINAGLMPTDVNGIFASLKKDESREGLTVFQEAVESSRPIPGTMESIPEHFEDTYSYAPVQ